MNTEKLRVSVDLGEIPKEKEESIVSLLEGVRFGVTQLVFTKESNEEKLLKLEILNEETLKTEEDSFDFFGDITVLLEHLDSLLEKFDVGFDFEIPKA